jgi:O-methyltransferase involved in polyketide biosynthesis
MKVALDLSPVEETLLVPLWARARENHEPDPILADERSLAIQQQLDYDFSVLDHARASQLGCCVRARLFDGWVRDFLRAHPGGTVVELGCGLNGRFERVDDGRVQWFDLDLPHVVALRRRFFADGARRHTLAGCAREPAWMDTVAAAARGPLLVVSEGMLPYFEPEQVRELFVRIAARFPGAEIVFDAMTPLVVRHQRHHDAMRHFRARFRWSLRQAADVEGWHPDLELLESRRFYDLLARHPRRLPRALRLLASGLGTLYPPFKRAYTLNRARVRA